MLIRVGEGTIQNKYVFHTLNMVKKQFRNYDLLLRRPKFGVKIGAIK